MFWWLDNVADIVWCSGLYGTILHDNCLRSAGLFLRLSYAGWLGLWGDCLNVELCRLTTLFCWIWNVCWCVCYAVMCHGYHIHVCSCQWILARLYKWWLMVIYVIKYIWQRNLYFIFNIAIQFKKHSVHFIASLSVIDRVNYQRRQSVTWEIHDQQSGQCCHSVKNNRQLLRSNSSHICQTIEQLSFFYDRHVILIHITHLVFYIRLYASQQLDLLFFAWSLA